MLGSVHSELAATRQQQRRVSAGGGGRYKCNAAAPRDLQQRSPYFSALLVKQLEVLPCPRPEVAL